MKVSRFDEADSYEPEKGWKRISLCAEADISIEHFVKPAGHASPMHDHLNQQILVVLKGTLVVRTDSDKEETLGEGDCIFLAGGERHSVINPSDEPAMGLDIFLPGRPLDFWSARISPQ